MGVGLAMNDGGCTSGGSRAQHRRVLVLYLDGDVSKSENDKCLAHASQTLNKRFSAGGVSSSELSGLSWNSQRR